MDERQQDVVGLDADGAYLITGKPGSGKTNLVVLRATYLVRSGFENTLVLTFGRVIKEFIVSGAQRLDPVHIRTFHGWAKETLAEAGIEPNLSGDFNSQIRKLIDELQSARNSGAVQPLDALLVDEVQDYPLGAAALFQTLSPRLFFAGDEHQRVYSRCNLEQFRQIAHEIELPYHYRNGRNICVVAAAIGNDPNLVRTSRYDEDEYPSRARLIRCPDLQDQVRQTVGEIQGQLRAYPNELIGVIVPLRDDLESVVEMLRTSEIAEYCQFQTQAEGYSAFDPTKPVSVSSVHGGKGLEFRAAHLLAMEGIGSFPQGNRRNIAYTAVTRAKTSLNAYHSAAVPTWLSAAFAQVREEPRPQITLRDIF